MPLIWGRKTFLAILFATVLLGVARVSTAEPPYEIVLVRTSIEGSEDFFMEAEAGNSANPWGVSDALCSNRSLVRTALGLPPAIAESAGSVLGSVGQIFGTIVDQAIGEPDPNAQEAWNEYEEFCNERGADYSANIVYSECSMTMWAEGMVLRFVLPVDGGDAEMVLIRPQSKLCPTCICHNFEGSGSTSFQITGDNWSEVTGDPADGCAEGDSEGSGTIDWIQTTRVRLGRVLGADSYAPKGSMLNATVEPRGGRSEHLGVPTKEVFFKYKGSAVPRSMSQQMAGLEEMPFDISLISEGTAWVTEEAPGGHIISTFYSNFSNQVVPPAEVDTLIGGMIKQMSGITQYGVPLRVTQETAVRIEGMPAMAIPTLGQKSFSDSTVTGVGHVLSNAEWCARTNIPSDWQLVELSDLYSGSPSGSSSATGSGASGSPSGSSSATGSGASASSSGSSSATASASGATGSQPTSMNPGGQPGAADMAAAMQEYKNAMEQLSPEEKATMEQFGLGGMMGGANPAAAGAAAPAAAATRSPGSGSNMPPSSELNSGNMTESVQKHLQALGYDVGAIDGEVSLDTSIAISTFQAEKGIDVTGKVSPQLLGILSAEVDSRR